MMKEPTGTYVCLKPDEATMKMVGRFIEANHILNGLQITKLHTTIVYSKVYDPTLKSSPCFYSAEFDHVRVMPSDNGKLCIAIELKSDSIQKLHRELLSDYKVTHTYPDFVVHMTVTYDGGQMPLEWNTDELNQPFNFDFMRVEDLNRDWTA
jgi:hypothetical protein